MLAFNESAELFGPPPEHDLQVRLLGEQLMAAVVAPDRATALRDCLHHIHAIQGDAYSEMLLFAFEAPTTGMDFKWMKGVFHAAARCGQARAYASFVASILAYDVGLRHRPGRA